MPTISEKPVDVPAIIPSLSPRKNIWDVRAARKRSEKQPSASDMAQIKEDTTSESFLLGHQKISKAVPMPIGPTGKKSYLTVASQPISQPIVSPPKETEPKLEFDHFEFPTLKNAVTEKKDDKNLYKSNKKEQMVN
jgi:hypothetical protein